jgi:hypothetical protein
MVWNKTAALGIIRVPFLQTVLCPFSLVHDCLMMVIQLKYIVELTASYRNKVCISVYSDHLYFCAVLNLVTSKIKDMMKVVFPNIFKVSILTTVAVKVTDLRGDSSLVVRYEHSGRMFVVSEECWYLPAKQRGITSQKTVIFIPK